MTATDSQELTAFSQTPFEGGASWQKRKGKEEGKGGKRRGGAVNGGEEKVKLVAQTHQSKISKCLRMVSHLSTNPARCIVTSLISPMTLASTELLNRCFFTLAGFLKVSFSNPGNASFLGPVNGLISLLN